MILKILTYPDPRLRVVAQPVKELTPELLTLTQDMLETMYAAQGIGLAAPQVGVAQRVIVIDSRPRDSQKRYRIEEQTELEQRVLQPLVLINPEILLKEGKTSFEEGCLSVPSYYETVERARWIKVKYQDPTGVTRTLETDGLLAIVIQHEMDHLEGTLFIDRLQYSQSQKIKKQIEKYGYPKQKQGEPVL